MLLCMKYMLKSQPSISGFVGKQTAEKLAVGLLTKPETCGNLFRILEFLVEYFGVFQLPTQGC